SPPIPDRRGPRFVLPDRTGRRLFGRTRVEVLLRMVEVVDLRSTHTFTGLRRMPPGAAGVPVFRWGDGGLPLVLPGADPAVVVVAGEGVPVDVGAPAAGPVFDVVDLAQLAGPVAARV